MPRELTPDTLHDLARWVRTHNFWLPSINPDTLDACADQWQADIKKATYLNRCEKRYHYFVGPGRCWCGKATLPPEVKP